MAKFFLSLEKFVAQFAKNFAKIQKKFETMPALVPWLNCHLSIPGQKLSGVLCMLLSVTSVAEFCGRE